MSLMKKILLIVIAILGIGIMGYMIINQQRMLNSYAAEKSDLQNQIEEAKETQEELKTQLEDIDSLNSIEDIAREKLDMYLPNERVYVDITQ